MKLNGSLIAAAIMAAMAGAVAAGVEELAAMHGINSETEAGIQTRVLDFRGEMSNSRR